MLKPAPTVPAYFIASRREPRLKREERKASANTSLTRPASDASSENWAIVAASDSVARDMLSPDAPARFSAGPVAVMISFVSIPARASDCIAVAACVAEYVVVEPKSLAVFVSLSRSAAVAPETAATVVISCSNFAPTTALAAPRAVIEAVAALNARTTIPPKIPEIC